MQRRIRKGTPDAERMFGKEPGYKRSGNPSQRKLGLEVVKIFPASAGKNQYHGEFDPGSERTLAARLKHASRAARGACSP